jgi:diadenylate cyclase
VTDFFSDFLFLFQRFTWLSAVDILLVTLIFFALLYILRDTQAMTLLRGVLFLVVFIILLTSLLNLPAFSWLVSTTLPALLLAIPVVFAPEIRRTLERIGRAGIILPLSSTHASEAQLTEMIAAVISASARLSARQHGALIIFQRLDNLDEYIATGVRMDARITPETLLQVFYPNTPLHDGAVIISNLKLSAAACIMPLSSSGILNHSPNGRWGFVIVRHWASLK